MDLLGLHQKIALPVLVPWALVLGLALAGLLRLGLGCRIEPD
jgi:hypothetical protein